MPIDEPSRSRAMIQRELEQPASPAKRKQASEAARLRHAKLISWWLEEKDRQAENRFQMAMDEDFYDGLQWSEDDVQDLLDRYQAPLTFNLIHPAVQWVTGSERRMKFDHAVHPREGRDVQGAGVKAHLLKYASDVNRTTWVRSQAFKDAVCAGVGWLEDCVNSDPTEEPLFSGYEHWRVVWHDSLNRQLDPNRARYVFRTKYVDLDIAEAMLPTKKDALQRAARRSDKIDDEEDEGWYLGSRLSSREMVDDGWVRRRSTYTNTQFSSGDSRERVKIIEAQYRMPMRVKIMRPLAEDVELLRGEVFQASQPLHVAAKEEGIIELIEVNRMMVRTALMTESDMLVDMLSPYNHRRFTLTPVWGYRRKRDGMPYGIVRLARDPQEDLNKRRSKSLFLLSSNRVIMDDGSYDDIEEVREEASRPDAVLVKPQGSELRIESSAQLAASHVEMEQINANYVREISGVTGENLGLDTNAQSGRAVLAKQQQGALVTQELFDNLRYAAQIQGENQMSIIEQFYTDARIIRIVGPDGHVSPLKINWEDDGTILNDILKAKADFVIGQSDYAENLRMALFEQMMELLGRMPPEIATRLLPNAVELVDLPQKDKLLSKLREITGEEDPTATLSPEEEERREQRMRAAEEQAQMARQTQMLTLEEQAARVDKERAQAELARAQAEKALSESGESGGMSERERQALKDLQKAQADLQKAQDKIEDLNTKINVMKVEAANEREKIATDNQTKLMVAAMKTAAQERSDSKAIDADKEVADKKAENDRELGERKIDTDAEVKREAVETQAEVARENAKDKVKADEKVGMAKAKAKPAAKSSSGKPAGEGGAAAEAASPAAPNITVNVVMPPEAFGAEGQSKGRKKRTKTTSFEKGKDGKFIMKTTED